MIIFAIDPGTEQSGWVLYDTETRELIRKGIDPNERIAAWCALHECVNYKFEHLVYEMIKHYGTGMPVGADVFETCVWIGRFHQAFGDSDHTHRILRKTVAAHLCGAARARGSHITQALVDKFGGPMKKAKGNRRRPGPLFGVKSHIWSALAVAVTFAEAEAANAESNV